eukprot:TRINITY_DN6156_c0_g2_i4.p1 TRINITY_DN6156_c0_g2~~TRINITY_DN6156_c0_g2_i4.p1  ORF type:complete len:341 (-),score=-14.12 TRINITY_DN6156_c0_g2_i4:153-1175(-)
MLARENSKLIRHMLRSIMTSPIQAKGKTSMKIKAPATLERICRRTRSCGTVRQRSSATTETTSSAKLPTPCNSSKTTPSPTAPSTPVLLFSPQGQLKDGNRHGRGMQMWPDGARYDGEWRDNQACGKGKFWHVDGDIFDGEWKNDKANGYGVYIHKDGAKYEGEWKDDYQHGYGIETWADNSKYDGDYRDGKKHGNGAYIWSDGSKYVGEWADNKICGKVPFNLNSGKICVGCRQELRGRVEGQQHARVRSLQVARRQEVRRYGVCNPRRVLHGQEARPRRVHVGCRQTVRRNVGEWQATWGGSVLCRGDEGEERNLGEREENEVAERRCTGQLSDQVNY